MLRSPNDDIAVACCLCLILCFVYFTCDMYVRVAWGRPCSVVRAKSLMRATRWYACSNKKKSGNIGKMQLSKGYLPLGTYDVYSGVPHNHAGTCSPCCPGRSLRDCIYRWIAAYVRFHNDRRANRSGSGRDCCQCNGRRSYRVSHTWLQTNRTLS